MSKQIPLYGVGTYLLPGDECVDIVKTAIQGGVRLIDTAFMYENEKEVGEGIRASGINRDELFVISKLNIEKHSYEGALESVKTALSVMGLEYFDLYLIHTPRPGGIVSAYKGLVEAQKLGLIREIGVSNFGKQHIQKLTDAGLPLPAYNEFEVHVWNQMSEKIKEMTDLGIKVIGYCPLARAKCFGQSPALAEVAAEEGQDEAMIALRWSISKGYVTIPKTANKDRLQGMMAVLLDEQKRTLSEAQLKKLEGANLDFFASMAVKAMWEEPVAE